MINDANENTSKNMNKFVCICCDFSASKLGDYKRHLLTRKHKRLTLASNANENANENANVIVSNDSEKYKCVCGKKFSHPSSLSRHKKNCDVCKIGIKSTEDLPQIVQCMKEMIEKNNEMAKTIVELSAQKTMTVNNVSNVNNINNTFNLNLFLNENCKDALNLTDFVNSLKLQLEDLVNMGKLGYVDGMSNIIIKELETLDVEKRPIHCSDIKRDVLYIKDNDQWERNQGTSEKLSAAVQDITQKNVKNMQTWITNNPQIKNGQSSKSDEFHKIVQNIFNNDQEKNDKKILKKIAKHTTIDKSLSLTDGIKKE